MGMERVWNGIVQWRNFIIVFMLPILLLPFLLIYGDSKVRYTLSVVNNFFFRVLKIELQ
jgi:hypothetical protein